LEQTGHELDDRRLSGAVLADERERLAALDSERHVRQHVAIGKRIPKPHVLELNRRDRPAPAFALVEVARWQLEELEQIAHVEERLVHAGHTVEERRELILNLDDPVDEEREVANRDGALCRTPKH